MLREEINQVKAIARDTARDELSQVSALCREIVKEEVAKALKKHFAKPQAAAPAVPAQPESVPQKNAKSKTT